jgi:hypothetical protein
MRKALFENKKEYPPMTKFQKDLSASIKAIPVIEMERK